jgi:hypothetical protein
MRPVVVGQALARSLLQSVEGKAGRSLANDEGSSKYCGSSAQSTTASPKTVEAETEWCGVTRGG